MDIYAIRRENLRVVVRRMQAEGHAQKAVAALLDDPSEPFMSPSFLSQLMGGKKMGDAVARKLEKRLHRAHGAMDQPLRERDVKSGIQEPDVRVESQSTRMDRGRIRDAITLLKTLGELQGVPALASDSEAIAIAYDFLTECETPVEPSNVLDLTKRLAATLRGNNNNGDGAANTG